MSWAATATSPGADAAVICTYTVYKTYGDTASSASTTRPGALRRLPEQIRATSSSEARAPTATGSTRAAAPKSEVVALATTLRRQTDGRDGHRIGKDEDAVRFARLSDDFAKLSEKLHQPGRLDQRLRPDRLRAGLHDGPDPARTAANPPSAFVEQIEKHDWHLATGFIGTPRCCPPSPLAGRNDVAYRLFLTDTFPSWLFQVKLGATTMWERWDGWTPDKGFQDPHELLQPLRLRLVGEWMYRTAAGIDTDGVAYKQITLRPEPAEGLNSANASYDSTRGKITCGWKRERQQLVVTLTIPPNTSATAYIPTKDSAKITESNEIAARQPGVKFLWTERGAAVFKLDSGSYEFEAP
jgi:alpha-L-rhamnosidase